MTATSLQGTHVNGSYLRFAQRLEHHDSKQPNLVVFTEDNHKQRKTFVAPSKSGMYFTERTFLPPLRPHATIHPP